MEKRTGENRQDSRRAACQGERGINWRFSLSAALFMPRKPLDAAGTGVRQWGWGD